MGRDHRAEQIRGWLGETELDLREGGEGTITFERASDVTKLRVRRLEPGRLVEYDWESVDEDPSILLLELEARDRGTLLVLDHRRLPLKTAPGYGAGWHAHLDMLDAHLGNAPFEYWARYRELSPTYEDEVRKL